MQLAGIAVKAEGRETTTHVTADSADTPNAGRFLYASGTRPLAGYTIKRGVGIGGFGEIYYAVSDAGKEVALKLVRRHLDVELRGIRHCLTWSKPTPRACPSTRSSPGCTASPRPSAICTTAGSCIAT
jgi:hypothetical protein